MFCKTPVIYKDMREEKMKQQIINIEKDTDYRIIAISDVHAHYELMQKMLDKIQLQEDDYLIIIGDFINRGKDSVKTYELIKKINDRKNTFVLVGNHEFSVYKRCSSREGFRIYYNFLIHEYYETMIGTKLKHLGKSISSFNNSDDLYDFIKINFAEEIEFFNKLPVMLNFNNFTFVHGGYDESFTLPQDELKFLKFKGFNERSKINKNKIIVGHWPACNMRNNELSNKPYFNDQKNIVFIDGGLGITVTGELNALEIIKKEDKLTYNNMQVNSFVKRKIIKEYIFDKEECLYIHHPHFEIEVLQKREKISVCRHLHSNKVLSIFNSYIIKKDNKTMLKGEFINNFFNLKIGDEVGLCEVYDDCALVKHNGEFGWVLSNQIS